MTLPGRLKLDLVVRGVRVDASVPAHANLLRAAPHDARERTIELVLPGDVRVTAPVDGTGTSPYRLAAEGSRYVVADDVGGGGKTEVRAVPPPRFYARSTSRGTPMRRLATVHGGHLVVHPGVACGFSVRGAPCRFCVEGARAPGDLEAASVGEVVEVVGAAFEEGVVDMVYVNSGAYDAEDGGVGTLAPYVHAIRKHFDTLIAMQVHPPRTNQWIDRTYAMGVDALSYNLEIFDRGLLNRHCIGRMRYIGRDRYLESLAYAATIFPRGTVWTDLVAGVEPTASTMAGIDALAAIDVIPVVALVRAEHALPAAADVEPVLAHLYRAVKARGINMGWVRDLALGITPLEARHFAGDDARLAVTVQSLTRSRLGGMAARQLARFRRRLRVQRVDDGLGAAHV